LSEIVIAGEFGEDCSDLYEKLISVPPGGECHIYFDSPGGNSYSATGLVAMMKLRNLKTTGIVLGECSSAAIWPFAACRRRLVTRHSVLLFHPMRWQSEENIQVTEASEWVRHYGTLSQDMDLLLARLFKVEESRLHDWIHPGRFVSGPEMAEAGLAELIELPM
jgi:ATP-dependent Clp protease, protease subunit